ncbi:MAG: hypothetical protein NTU53_13110, partial [Planctomycetota bacterium]|nr:hypothetical protein [Planctomycetota bacterium]
MAATDTKTKIVAAMVALLIIAGTTLFIVNQFSSRPKSEAIPVAPTGDSPSEPVKTVQGPH